MFGLGTIVNTAAIVLAGVGGALFGKLLKERHAETLTMASGISVLFIGISSAMEGMLKISEEGVIASTKSLLLVLCLALGALIGELLNIERWFEQFGEWLKEKTKNSNDSKFVDGFVTASLTVSIGAMAVIGSIQDGIKGDSSILITKAIIDFVIIFVMTSSMGKGCAFSAIPVFVLEGIMTLAAFLIKPIMTDLALGYLSLVGSVLIFCVGLNLIWGKKVRVANLLPALIFAIVFSFLPISL